MEVKISVIIPVYNTAAYLKECLDSVLTQSLKEIEIICVNDGSKDHSLEILNELAWKDKRIKIINKENEGVSKARNIALKEAKGEYVYFLDSDDLLEDENVLKETFESAIKNNVDICGGGLKSFGVDFEVRNFTGNLAKYNFADNGIVEYIDYQYDYGFYRFAYKLSFLRENGLDSFPEYTFFEDPVFFVKAMLKAKKFYALKRYNYRYRVGYKEIQWTPKRVVHLLSGFRDVIKFAYENNLKDLLSLEMFRLEYDYRNAILSQIDSEYSVQIKELFTEINEYLSSGRELIEYKMFKRREEELRYEIWKRDTGNEDIRRTFTYRFGNFFLAIPKKIVRKIIKR